MIVPIIPGSKIINQTIVYGNATLLEKEQHIKVTKIEQVPESLLEKCLSIIFHSNLDVLFHTIQYSKKEKIVSFYTEQEISTKEWNNLIDQKPIYAPVMNATEILDEIKKILVSEQEMDSDYVSLADVFSEIQNKYQEYRSLKEKEEKRIQKVFQKKSSEISSLKIDGFHYDTHELNIMIWEHNRMKRFCFGKENGQLFLKHCNSLTSSSNDEQIVSMIGIKLSKLYDKLMEYEDFYQQYSINKPLKNSNLRVSIFQYGINVHTLSSNTFTSSDFELRASCFEQNITNNCDSSTVHEIIRGNEQMMFEKLFVKICDCPMWLRRKLNQMRQKKLVMKKI